jgi:aspartate aminotransferase-like enzyme
VNAHETSTGVLYDIPGLGQICRDNGLYFVVDAISAFLCDPLSMRSMGIDILITSSQKALALAPGLSVITLSPRAVERIESANVRSHYFGLKKYLVDGVRGQAPFTPAVGIILQLHERLCGLEKLGVEHCIQHSAALAAHFRQSIQGLPYRQFPEPFQCPHSLEPLKWSVGIQRFRNLAFRLRLGGYSQRGFSEGPCIQGGTYGQPRFF